MNRVRLFVVLVLAVALAPFGAGRLAQAADAGVPDAAAHEASADALAAVDPAVAALDKNAKQIRELLASTLDISVDPTTLFDVPLDAPRDIDIEAHRLAAMLATLDADAGDAGRAAYTELLVRELRVAADAGADADAGTITQREGPAVVSPELFAARVALDRERMAFYALPEKERRALLDKHEERRRSTADEGLSEAERKSQAAEEEQKKALEEARKARTEAQRRVREEHARLLGVSKEQADFEVDVARRRETVTKRRDDTLAFQRKIDDLIAKARAKPGSTDEDVAYDDLSARLQDARDKLAVAIGRLGSTAVPSAGPDRLEALAAQVESGDVRRQRAEVEAEAVRLRALDEEVRFDRAKQLYDETETLNRKRIDIIDELTPAKRRAVTGFGPAGVDQAIAEGRQVVLVLRYHVRVTARWLSSVRTSGSARGKSAMSAAFFLFKALIATSLFVWWRRRAASILQDLQKRARAESRKQRAVAPSWIEFALGVAIRVRPPLEWLIVVAVVSWLLPLEARGLLEVRLIATILGWVLGGALVVRAIDAIASRGDEGRLRRSRVQTAHLRFQTLRLIGRVVVALGLLLSVTERIVGEGTIYGWVISTCWFLAVPIVLVIVRWWRSVIFERIALIRKKRAFDRWVDANQSGWVSFPAAIAGGAYLLVSGLYRIGRAWIGRFDLTRRALAYLFQRGLDKMAEEKARLDVERLPNDLFAALGPDTPSKLLLGGVAEEELERVIARIREPGGGVFAIVGERGAGKSTLLRRILEAKVDARVVQCPKDGGLGGLRRELVRVLDLPDGASLSDAGRALNASAGDNAVMIDDAHLLVRPMMGGLDDFDRLLDVARHNSDHCTWVFTLDEVIWRFFERSRGARPLFDDVILLEGWREEDIARLVQERSKATKLTPNFNHLLEKLPKDADEVDVEEALARVCTSFYRLLWDYAGGNPGVALHAWRTSLGVDTDGEVWVKLFQAPDSRDLDRLSEGVAFVLRAVVQLEPAHPDQVRRATMLSRRRVDDALRYALARGYVRRDDGLYRVTWAWFRPITRFLQRRHLLTSK